MKRFFVMLLLMVAINGYPQFKLYYQVPNKNTRFNTALAVNQVVFESDSSKWYKLTHMVSARDSMNTVFRNNWYTPASGSAIPEYWVVVTGPLGQPILVKKDSADYHWVGIGTKNVYHNIELEDGGIYGSSIGLFGSRTATGKALYNWRTQTYNWNVLLQEALGDVLIFSNSIGQKMSIGENQIVFNRPIYVNATNGFSTGVFLDNYDQSENTGLFKVNNYLRVGITGSAKSSIGFDVFGTHFYGYNNVQQWDVDLLTGALRPHGSFDLGSLSYRVRNSFIDTSDLVKCKLRGDLKILNKNGSAWLPLLTRITSGTEAKYDLTNIGKAVFDDSLRTKKIKTETLMISGASASTYDPSHVLGLDNAFNVVKKAIQPPITYYKAYNGNEYSKTGIVNLDESLEAVIFSTNDSLQIKNVPSGMYKISCSGSLYGDNLTATNQNIGFRVDILPHIDIPVGSLSLVHIGDLSRFSGSLGSFICPTLIVNISNSNSTIYLMGLVNDDVASGNIDVVYATILAERIGDYTP